MREALSSNGFAQDVGYALRAFRRNRAFFLFATLIIGLGVGASTAVFSVMSPLLLQPLPFHDPGRLVLIENSGTGGLSSVTSRTSNVRDFREQVRSFELGREELIRTIDGLYEIIAWQESGFPIGPVEVSNA